MFLGGNLKQLVEINFNLLHRVGWVLCAVAMVSERLFTIG